MECLKFRTAPAVFVLYLLLAPTPCLMRDLKNEESPEVYEIDYRGPETHSYLPPPDRSAGGGRHHHHHNFRTQNAKVASPQHNSKDLRLVNTGTREKEIHG